MTTREDFISVITSMKPQGFILSIGADTLPVQASVVDSMDMLSRLVVNLPPELAPQKQESALESDLRVAIHRQEPCSFLDDISHHKFNIAIVGSKDLSDELLPRIVNMLMESGCLLILEQADDGCQTDARLQAHGRHMRVGSITVLVKVQPRAPRVRKGGRRSRKALAVSQKFDTV